MKIIFSWLLFACVVTQLCPTLSDPMDYSLPGSSLHGIFQARILEWVAIFLLQGIFLTQELNARLLCLLHCRQILNLLSLWEALHAEAPILWPPDAKSQVTGRDLMLGKIGGRRRRGQQRMR